MKQFLALLAFFPLHALAQAGSITLAYVPASQAGGSASIRLEYSGKTARIKHSWNDISRREFEEDGVSLSGLSGDSFSETLFKFRHYGVERKNGEDGEASALTLYTTPDHSESVHVDFTVLPQERSTARVYGNGKAWKSLADELPGSYDATPRAEFLIEEFKRTLYFFAEE